MQPPFDALLPFEEAEKTAAKWKQIDSNQQTELSQSQL